MISVLDTNGSWVIDAEVHMDVPYGATVEGLIEIQLDITSIGSKQNVSLTHRDNKVTLRVNIDEVMRIHVISTSLLYSVTCFNKLNFGCSLFSCYCMYLFPILSNFDSELGH